MVRIHSVVILQGGLAMSSSRFKNLGVVLLTFAMLLIVACHKKVAPPPPAAAAPPPPAPAPPPPAPTITLRANPTTINRGQPTTLQWEARNAATVRIEPGLGDVMATGNRAVNPASSVTSQATAMGPGGTATDAAGITVIVPPPSPTPPRREPRKTPDAGTEQPSRQTAI